MSKAGDWASNALHKFLVQSLPFYVLEPFSDAPRLDIPKLHRAMNISHETVYRWMRENRIRPKYVTQIVSLAAQPENRTVLKQLSRQLPKKEDFTQFLFN